MKVVTCDHPGCKSYYQSHPTACHDIDRQLKDRGWQVHIPPVSSPLYFCQAHKKTEAEVGPVEVDVESDVA